MPFKGGPKEAAKMLQGLGGSAARKLIEEIRKKDPTMADFLESKLISLEDLQYISAAQLVGLLRDVPLETFGLALRGLDKTLIDKILSQVSTGIRLDIEDGLKGPPRKVSDVEAAQDKILAVMREKIDKGHLVLDPKGDTLV